MNKGSLVHDDYFELLANNKIIKQIEEKHGLVH